MKIDELLNAKIINYFDVSHLTIEKQIEWFSLVSISDQIKRSEERLKLLVAWGIK